MNTFRSWNTQSEVLGWTLAITGLLLGALWGAGLLTSTPSEPATATVIGNARHYGDGIAYAPVTYTTESGYTGTGQAPTAGEPGQTLTIGVTPDGQIVVPDSTPARILGGLAGGLIGGALALFGAVWALAKIDTLAGVKRQAVTH